MIYDLNEEAVRRLSVAILECALHDATSSEERGLLGKDMMPTDRARQLSSRSQNFDRARTGGHAALEAYNVAEFLHSEFCEELLHFLHIDMTGAEAAQAAVRRKVRFGYGRR